MLLSFIHYNFFHNCNNFLNSFINVGNDFHNNNLLCSVVCALKPNVKYCCFCAAASGLWVIYDSQNGMGFSISENPACNALFDKVH